MVTCLPKFKECAKHPHIEEKGYVLYYTSQCPFNVKYVPIIEETAKENGVQFVFKTTIKINSGLTYWKVRSCSDKE